MKQIIGFLLIILSVVLTYYFYIDTPKNAKIIDDKYYRESKEIYYGAIVGIMLGIGIGLQFN